VAFAAVALVLSLVTAGVVWTTVSNYLLVLRERDAVAQTLGNVEQVQRGLAVARPDPAQLLDQVSRESGSVSLLATAGQWFTTSLTTGRDTLPAELRETVLGGQAASQRTEIDGSPRLVVGVPLPQEDAGYFEVFPLDELDSTFRVLSAALAITMLGVPIGALLLGRWVTRPALRPLERVSTAAAAVAGGNLQARMDAAGDPDLEPIADSFNATADALERRMRNDARFAADVSHELRSPLTAMVAAAELLGGYRAGLPPDGKVALDLLRSDLDRFTRLVQDLLEISRTDAGSAALALEDVCVADLVRHALPPALRNRLSVTPSAQDVVVQADKRRLERVVANLVDNAQQHGGGLRAVTVVLEEGQVRICVDDDGPGIAPDDRERILERFARGRGRARASTQGAGLGLALVSRHVTLMDGHISVAGSPSGGSRFVVALRATGDPG